MHDKVRRPHGNATIQAARARMSDESQLAPHPRLYQIKCMVSCDQLCMPFMCSPVSLHLNGVSESLPAGRKAADV